MSEDQAIPYNVIIGATSVEIDKQIWVSLLHPSPCSSSSLEGENVHEGVLYFCTRKKHLTNSIKISSSVTGLFFVVTGIIMVIYREFLFLSRRSLNKVSCRQWIIGPRNAITCFSSVPYLDISLTACTSISGCNRNFRFLGFREKMFLTAIKEREQLAICYTKEDYSCKDAFFTPKSIAWKKNF